MRIPRMRISDRTLRRWLRTGRPRRVTQRLEADESVVSRLEALSRLAPGQTTTLSRLTTPAPEFETRVREQVLYLEAKSGVSSILVDLVALGIHVGRTLAPGEGSRRGFAAGAGSIASETSEERSE